MRSVGAGAVQVIPDDKVRRIHAGGREERSVSKHPSRPPDAVETGETGASRLSEVGETACLLSATHLFAVSLSECDWKEDRERDNGASHPALFSRLSHHRRCF